MSLVGLKMPKRLSKKVVNTMALVDNYMLTKYLDPNTVPTNTKGFWVTMVDHICF